MRKAIVDLQSVEKQAGESWQRVRWLWNSVQGKWNDEVHDRFDAQHVAPLEEHTRRFQSSLASLIKTLRDAERDLG
jgi:hypothetical protein